MSLDPVTEKIAHFIGAFQMLTEEARLRMEYNEFRALKAAQKEAEILDLDGFQIKHTYKLKDFDEGLGYKFYSVPALRLEADPKAKIDGPELAKTNSPIPQTAPAGKAIDGGVTGPAFASPGPTTQTEWIPVPGDGEITFTMALPSQLIAVIIQQNQLNDVDIFGQTGWVGEETLEGLFAGVELLAHIAFTLSPIPTDLTPIDTDWLTAAPAMQTAAQAIAEMAAPGLTVAVMTGVEAMGIYIDGELSDELPSFDDLLPRYVADRIAEAEAKAEAAEAAHDFGDDFEQDNDEVGTDAGFEVVTGVNSLTNTTSIMSNWLDAGVIVASGNVVRFDAISQINVLIDHDTINGTLVADAETDPASTAQNVAAIRNSSSRSDEHTPGNQVLDAPDNWVVVRYDGPVTQINWTKQHNFVTDFDQATITQVGAALFLGMGENILSNAFDAFELGFVYDLIVVGGNIFDINILSQKNVLLDSDTVTGPAAPAVAVGAEPQVLAESGFASAPVNFTDTAEATIKLKDENGLATEGAAKSADSVSGIKEKAPLDTDDPDDPVAVAEETPAYDAPAPTISTADNLLYNQALIERIGTDTDTAITETFQKAISDLADGADTISEEVAQDDLFDGVELLRVLYIDGDFTSVNLVDQTNVLGDADQVHLARDDFAAALQKQIEVTTGSNILANVASIRDQGVDSTVMAQGQTYSDALIHQANLLDTGCGTPPPGAKISALASEAVAFLAEDMIGKDLADEIVANTAAQMADMPGASDIMQSMTA